MLINQFTATALLLPHTHKQDGIETTVTNLVPCVFVATKCDLPKARQVIALLSGPFLTITITTITPSQLSHHHNYNTITTTYHTITIPTLSQFPHYHNSHIISHPLYRNVT